MRPHGTHHLVNGLEDIQILPLTGFNEMIPPSLGIRVSRSGRQGSQRIADRLSHLWLEVFFREREFRGRELRFLDRRYVVRRNQYWTVSV